MLNQAPSIHEQLKEGSLEKRASIRVACQECRARKSKCDGGRPQCQNCIKKQSPCHYEAAPDETRVGALKRKYTDLQRQNIEQQRFLELLKTTDSDQDAFELVRRVRAGQDVSTIVNSTPANAPPASGFRHYIRPSPPDCNKVSAGYAGTTGPGDVPKSASGSHSPMRRVSITSLLTSASDTLVSDGSSEVSSPDSIGSFFTGADYMAVHADSPRASFRSGNAPSYDDDTRSNERAKRRKSSSHWSYPGASLDSDRMAVPPSNSTKGPLQNICGKDWDVDYIGDDVFREILESFLYWDHPTWAIFDEIAFRDGLTAGGSEYCNKFLVHMIIAFASKIYSIFHPGKVDSAEQHAIAAARRLWDEESTRATPANIVGALIMNAFLACTGKEKIPSEYMKQAVVLAHQMGLFDADLASEVYNPLHRKRTRSRAVLAWGLFAHQAYSTCFFNLPPLLTAFPPTPIPDAEPTEDNETWTPFPMSFPRKPCCSSTRFVARTTLWSIGNDIVPLHRRYQQRPTSAEHILNALALYDRLRAWHDGLDPRLHRLYDAPPHLFQLHTDYQRAVIELFRPFLDVPRENQYDWPPDAMEQAQRVSIAAHRQIRFLLHELDRQFWDLPLPLETLTPLISVAHDTISHLAHDPKNHEHIYYLCLCLRMLIRMAESFAIIPYIVQAIDQVANRHKVKLPSKARTLANLIEERFQTAPNAIIATTLPIDLGLLQSDQERARLEYIIKEMEKTTLDCDL